MGRRVEAAHAEIKRLGQHANNVLPPWISAAVSEHRNLARLDNDSSFQEFCIDNWRSTNMLDDLLHLIVSKHDLADMTRQTKVNFVYQCALETEYRPMHAEVDVQQRWLVNTMHLRSDPKKMPDSWKSCVALLKAKLTKGLIHSLPADVFALCSAFSLDGNHDFEVADPWSETVAAALDVPGTFDFATVHDVIFFETINAYPERRSHVDLQQTIGFNDSVRVSSRKVMSFDEDSKRVVLISVADSSSTIHLLPLVASMCVASRSLYAWQVLGHGVAESVRRLRDAMPPPMYSSILLPSATMVLALPLADAALVSATQSSGIVSTLAVADDVAARCLVEVDRARGERDATGMDQLQGVMQDDIRSLIQSGALHGSEDDFGVVAVSRNPGGVRFVSLQVVGSPIPFLHVQTHTSGVKLDMVLALVRDGWANATSHKMVAYKRGASKLFVNDMRRPASYYVCLLSARTLFNKGVPEIPHDWKDIQYQCVLRLHGVQLRQFLMQGLDEQWCRVQLKDAERDIFAHALELENLVVGLGDGNGAIIEQPPPALMPAILDDVEPEWTRFHAIHRGVSVKVIFDHRTGGDMRQRGYANCVCKEHGNCFRWRPCAQFEDRRHYGAYMYAWASSHNLFRQRSGHMSESFEPLARQIQEVRSELDIVDF